MKPEYLKLLSLNGERRLAYLTARALSNGQYELFGLYVWAYGSTNIPRFLRLVADAWEEKPSKFDLTPTGLAIVKAWKAAYGLAGRMSTGFEAFAKPKLLDVKIQYALAYGLKPDHPQKRKWIAELERKKRIPADQTFRIVTATPHVPLGWNREWLTCVLGVIPFLKHLPDVYREIAI